MSRTRSVGIAATLLVLGLFLVLPVSAATADPSPKASSPSLTPTTVCSCGTSSAADTDASSELRGHGPPPPVSQAEYDEQIGITFTQSYTSIEYNVTAVAQTDPTLDTGPAYLVDGLGNNGYWYQVGISYNWGPGQDPGTGFDMNYEVFNSYGDSIYPSEGGGLQAFSGPVHEGDTIVLDLYISSGQVVMIAEDLNTSAYAQQTYSADGASYFAGLPNEVANANGFFTGLMTEWYHGEPYYTNPEGVTYTTSVPASSGWLWMDEWNPDNNALVFAANASAPTSFTNEPSTLQEFSYGSTTEYADATEFVTGALNSTSSGGTGGDSGGTGSTSTGSATQVTMTFSYSVQGTGTGYSAPVLTYTSDGTQRSVSLTTTPTSYRLDNGSEWSVSNPVVGESSDERIITSESTSGSAVQGGVVALQYQNQYYVTVTLNDGAGGSVQPASGWYDSGQTLNISATANSDWKFEGWSTNETTGTLVNSSSISLQVNGPISEDAIFYAGLVLTAPTSAFVTYSVPNPADGETAQGTVQPGTTTSVYVPPSSEIVLGTSPTSFLYSSAWSIPGSSSSSTIAIEVFSPSSIAPVSSFNYSNVAIVGGSLALLLVIVAAALVMRRKPRTWTVDGQVTLPPPEEPGPPPPADI